MRQLSLSRRTSESFLSGVSFLTVSAIVVKLIGLAYRIPMLRILGTEGMGYFNTAYEVYALLCVLSTAGLPVAMSVLIAGGRSGQDPARIPGLEHKIYRVSLAVFSVVGVLGTLVLLLPARLWAEILGDSNAAVCIRAVSPAVLAVCLAGAVRGYFQGLSDMRPTAVSQVIEALGKLLLGLTFAYLAAKQGADLPHIAAAAVLGLTVGTAASALWLFWKKARYDRDLSPSLLPRSDLPGDRYILHRLASVALPVTLSAGVISLTKCVDLALILRRLQVAGVSRERATALYGCYSTLAVPVFNILPSLATSVSMSLMPTLSEAVGRLRGDTGEARAMICAEAQRTTARAMGLTLFLSIPAGLGLCVLGGDVLTLLFRGQPVAVAEATPWLRVLGLAVPAACLITVTGAMLQASGHPTAPVLSMLIGTALKSLMAYWLLVKPGWGMMAAPVSSLCCDAIILTVNGLLLAHYAPEILPGGRVLVGLFLLPILLALPALAGASHLYGVIGMTGDDAITILCRIGIVAGFYVAEGALLGLLYYKKRKSHDVE